MRREAIVAVSLFLTLTLGGCGNPPTTPEAVRDWQVYGLKYEPAIGDIDDKTKPSIIKWIEDTCHTDSVTDVQILQLPSRFSSDRGPYTLQYVPVCLIGAARKPPEQPAFKIVTVCTYGTLELERRISEALNNKHSGARLFGSYNALNDDKPGMFSVYYLAPRSASDFNDVPCSQ